VAGSSLLLGPALAFGLHAVRAPFRQRDDLRRRIEKLEADAQRDRIEFTLKASTERLPLDYPIRLKRDGIKCRRNTVLWVTVTNNAKAAATFSAFIKNGRGMQDVSRGIVGDALAVEVVPWENLGTRTCEIGADGGSARLKVLNVARRPRPWCFWFWTLPSLSWASPAVKKHLKGWRLRPVSNVVQFELTVTNETDNKRAVRPCSIRFKKGGRVAQFVFDRQTHVAARRREDQEMPRLKHPFHLLPSLRGARSIDLDLECAEPERAP
jgi:hypothetical protein